MKTAYIMRGIPGSGKSTVARQIASQFEDTNLSVAIHSTDDLCMVDGEYKFDSELAPQRHAQNLENFKLSLDDGVPCVIVDNTSVKVQQFAPYVEAARVAGYAVVMVELVHPSLDEAVSRTTHGVPREIINQMILDWEPAQHCVTVDSVEEAYQTVCFLQKNVKGAVRAALGIGFGTGSAIGALVVGLAWALIS